MEPLHEFQFSPEMVRTNLKEAEQNGFWVTALQAPNGIIDQNSRPLRTTGQQSVVAAAWEWFANAINFRDGAIARRKLTENPILFPNFGVSRPLVLGMNPEGTASEPWGNYPLTVHWKEANEVETKYHTEYPYPYPENEYYGNTGLYNMNLVGNPWSMGGEYYFKHNAYRDPQDAKFEGLYYSNPDQLREGHTIVHQKRYNSSNKAA